MRQSVCVVLLFAILIFEFSIELSSQGYKSKGKKKKSSEYKERKKMEKGVNSLTTHAWRTIDESYAELEKIKTEIQGEVQRTTSPERNRPHSLAESSRNEAAPSIAGPSSSHSEVNTSPERNYPSGSIAGPSSSHSEANTSPERNFSSGTLLSALEKARKSD